MPRIPDETIERLKQEISLERLAEARGIKLARHGADLIGLCPFHDDHEPSLVVSPKKNLWHCLGACQGGGTVIDWVMKSEGVSFRHAVELLRADVPVVAASHSIKTSTVRKLPPPVDRDAGNAAMLEQVVGFAASSKSYLACESQMASQAQKKIPAAVQAALNALSNPNCSGLIGQGTAANGSVVSAAALLMSLAGMNGPSQYGSISPGSINGRDNATTTPVTYNNSVTTAMIVDIVLNDIPGTTFGAGNVEAQAITLLHELGHAFYDIFGPTSTLIRPDGNSVPNGAGISAQNTTNILNLCFK